MKKTVLSLLVFALLAFALVGCGSISSTTQSSTPTATKTVIPTKTSVPAAQSGSTTLGQPLSHFVARYGQPQNMDNGASYDFNNHVLSVFAYKQDNYLVNAVLYANNDGNGWNTDESATTACRQFLPDDATYQRRVDLGTTGYQSVYLSPSVAPLFKASDFTDENLNITTPGTLAIVYSYPIGKTSPLIFDCSVQVGLQQK